MQAKWDEMVPKPEEAPKLPASSDRSQGGRRAGGAVRVQADAPLAAEHRRPGAEPVSLREGLHAAGSGRGAQSLSSVRVRVRGEVQGPM